jgi:hypothetical protein
LFGVHEAVQFLGRLGPRVGSVVFRLQLEQHINPATKPRGGTAQERPLPSPDSGGMIIW